MFVNCAIENALMTLEFTRWPRLDSSCYDLTATVTWVGRLFSIAAVRDDKMNGIKAGIIERESFETYESETG